MLTIGMPLVAGLTLREFAGVLAHEFGHFSQGMGMRLTYLIRSISHWFTRVVYERDAWDERLVHWSQSLDIRLGWVVYLARFFVWITRWILWVLMMVGHAVSSFLLRQMEFDADRHEARLAGSDAFESTMRKIFTLSIAARGAQSDLGEFYREGRLGDNLPKLILHNVNGFTPEAHGQIEKLMTANKTGLFATHPSETARIAGARRENAPGIFQLELLATVLFRDFDAQCAAVTWDFYSGIFGNRLRREDIHAVDDLLARQGLEQGAFKALHRYLQGTFRANRPLPLSSEELSAADDMAMDEPTIQTLAGYREQLLELAPRCRNHTAQDDLPPTPRQQAALEAALQAVETVTRERLQLGLQLLHAPTVVAQLPEAAAWQAEVARLLPILKVLNDEVATLHKLHAGNGRLATRLQFLNENNNDAAAVEAVLDQRDESLALLREFRDRLDRVRYPFDHAKGSLPLGRFAIEAMPLRDNMRDIFETAEQAVRSLSRLRARVTGQLCLFAEAVEAMAGLEPLPEPIEAEAASGEDE